MRAVLVVLAALLPGLAAAATVEVRSGEHVDFSRLVLMFDAADGWQLGRVSGGYEFRATREDVSFRLAGVFRIMPRTRIREVAQPAPGVLFIASDCVCHADGFDLRGGRVVIDIKDGAPSPANPFETRLAMDPSRAGASPAAVSAPDTKSDTATDAAGPLAVSEITHLSPASSEEFGTSGVDGAAQPFGDHSVPSLPIPAASHIDREETDAQTAWATGLAAGAEPTHDPSSIAFDIAATERARAFEAMVIDQLARAGSQGLVIPNESPPSAPPPEAHGAPQDGAATHWDNQAAPADTSGPAPELDGASDREMHRVPPDATAPDHGHVRIETVIDRDRPSPPSANLTDGGRDCIPDARTDLAGWGHLVEGKPDIASYRMGLTDELDRVIPEKALALARYYVFLTLGAEALDALELAGKAGQEGEILAAIATAMDRDAQATTAGIFAGQETCPTGAALWAIASGPPLRHEQPVNTEAAIQAFDALPDHVKRHLGPRLVDSFRSGGQLEAAEIVRNRIDLAGAGDEVDVAISKARLDQALGHAVEAERDIETVLSETDPDSPEALLALAETRIRAGKPVDDSLLTALEAVAFDLGQGSTSRRIERAIAESHLLRDEFRQARDFALNSRGALNDDEAIDLLRRVYAALAARAPDETFLRLTLPVPRGLGEGDRDRAARLAISHRLLGLGFAPDALAVLGDLDASSGPDALQAGAAAALKAGRPATAIELALMLAPESAAPLVAAANETSGHYDAAKRYYDEAGDPGGAARMSLMMGDWASLSHGGADEIAAAAQRLARSEGNGPRDTPASLGKAKDLIAESQADRAAFEALLVAQ